MQSNWQSEFFNIKAGGK